MNILPKKRWHVRTKDNIARVRKDEAAAREAERKKQEKQQLAESEARVNFLRKSSGVQEKRFEKHTDDKQRSIEDECISQHVNLFADYKTHVKTSNKDLEREKKEEQEKYEKKIGYLTYLGQDTNEALRLKSWYEIVPMRLEVGSERGDITEKDLKTKHNHDPLTLINALLPPEIKSDAKSTTYKRKRSLSPHLSKNTEHSKSSKKHKKEHRKHKKERRRKTSKDSNHKRKKQVDKDVEDKQIKKRLKLEQMRKERLRRESTERARQEFLLGSKQSTNTDVKNGPPKIVQKYNSQFNPELAKQNINKEIEI